MSLVWTATGGWTFSRQTSNNRQAYFLGGDLYITWYLCSIRQHMPLEEIPFIWMAGCLGNCSRASSSFQQCKIIDWIPPQTGQVMKGAWPRGCPSLLSHCHSRDVQEEAECTCESRPSGKGRSGNSIEPVALTLSDSFRLSRQSAQMIWGEISNFAPKHKPKRTQDVALPSRQVMGSKKKCAWQEQQYFD